MNASEAKVGNKGNLQRSQRFKTILGQKRPNDSDCGHHGGHSLAGPRLQK